MQSIVVQLRALSLHTGGLIRASSHRINIGQTGSALQAWTNTQQIRDRKISSPLVVQTANMSFFNQSEASEIWSAMSGVSSQGKKRGRARGMMKVKNLNRGQVLGIGKKRVSFPGLSSKVVTGAASNAKPAEIGEISEKEYEKNQETIISYRDQGGGGRFSKKASPLERGWSGSRPTGRKFGPPQSENQDLKFNNFESILLEFKNVQHMTGNFGRVRRTSNVMVTGNRNGTVGYSLTAGKYGKNQKFFMVARNRAGLRLINIDRYEDRTVYHDFFTQYYNTRIFVEQRPFGFGLRCHRVIKAICEMAGIRDIYAKIEGSNNTQSIVKAFFLGLMRQKTHQAMADEKQLHLIEMRPEEDYFPRLVASPSDGKVRTQAEIGHNEILDFQLLSFEGNMVSPRIEKRNPYEGTGGWDLHLRRGFALESHERVKRRLSVEEKENDGFYKSFLVDKYPECKFEKLRKRKYSEAES